MLACTMGFLGTVDWVMWPPSLSRDRKWTCVTECTHSQVVGLRLEGSLFVLYGRGSFGLSVRQVCMLVVNVINSSVVMFHQHERWPMSYRHQSLHHQVAPLSLTSQKLSCHVRVMLDCCVSHWHGVSAVVHGPFDCSFSLVWSINTLLWASVDYFLRLVKLELLHILH